MKDYQNYNGQVKEQELSVLRDLVLGKMASSYACCACLAEIQFMEVPAVGQWLRLNAPKRKTVGQTARSRPTVADALADLPLYREEESRKYLAH